MAMGSTPVPPSYKLARSPTLLHSLPSTSPSPRLIRRPVLSLPPVPAATYPPDGVVDRGRRAAARALRGYIFFGCAVKAHDPAKKPKSIVDVGCGAGGSSRYLANKYGAQCRGITLSSVEAERGNALAAAQGLSDKASFQVADALEQPFSDGQFDLVWSMESAEHMPNKQKFVSELARVAAPGATIVIVTWCHRNLDPSEDSLKPDELSHLKRICETSHLPNWCSPSDYIKIVKSLSLEDIRTADWSEYVAPFFPAVIKSTFTWKGLISLLSGGWKTIKGAMALPIMIKGYKRGLIKYTIITCRKPQAA